MQPPRYLLREAVVKDLLRGARPGRFLEVGYGAGFTLATLAELGFTGVGYDRSTEARAAAERWLEERRITTVTLVDGLPTDERFDYVFLFEVVGYFHAPGEELGRLRRLVKDGGMLVMSFSGPNARYARSVDSDMRTFPPEEMRGLLTGAGFSPIAVHNYGFPLVNVMRPVLNVYQTVRGARPDVGQTGLQHGAPLVSAVSRALRGKAMAPFIRAQRLFRHTRLGNGYVVSARAT